MSAGICGAPCCAEPIHVSLQLGPNRDHLLSSNTAPLDTDIPLIRKIVEDSQVRADALNSRIDALRATVDQLIEERDTLVDDVQRHNAVLAPIRRIPPEIVCEILAWMPQSNRRIDDTPVEQPPWWLGHICRSWRETALGDSRLWRSFNILHTPTHPHQAAYSQSMIQTQLLRSANTTLTIKLHWREDEVFDDSPALATLLASSNRWECIFLRTQGETSRTALLDVLHGLKGQLSQLHKLEFWSDGDEEYSSESSVRWDAFSIAPRLRHVFLTNSRSEQYSPNVLVPWQHITRYRGVFNLARQLDILQNSPNLVECAIGFDDPNETHDDVMVTLPHLRRLFADWTVLVSHLTLPALAELFTIGAVYPLLPFIHRSSCRLTTLVLTNSSSEGLMPVLQASPLLEYLHLGESFAEPPTTGVLLTAMTVSGTSADILPNLTSFVYACTTCEDSSSHDHLFPMIRSRLDPQLPCRLAFVRFYSPGSITAFQQAMLAGIRTLKDANLDARYLDRSEGRALVSQNRP
ncbi:hypothetical protein B0H11DRAFT_1952381 [Mycena galericulata]|nr:hypothetical protein B0H11DRAFT_1964216 [Mycena galericulata]KAJ7511644.1 hypothetical protein B0H11DRAFT_1952381 [Mycena galericulata]